jgi:DNA-binding MarR family transcriptional regulator
MDSFRLVTLIRRLHLAIRAQLTEDLRARGYHDITPSHIYVFQTPGPDGVRPTELAARALMTKQAMNHLLTGLEERGYIERVTATGDGRARVLRLTPKGRRLTKLIQETSADIERRWSESLGSARMHDLLTALEHLDTIGPRQNRPAPVN